MFDKLVESTTSKKKSRGAYFIATAAIWSFVLSTTIVAGIFAFDGRLSDFEKAVMLAVPPPPPPPPPPSNGSGNPRRPERSQPVERFVSVERIPQTTTVSENRLPPVSGPIDTTGGPGTGVPGGRPDGVDGGVIDGVPFGVRDGRVSDAPPPRPPDPPAREVERPVQQKPILSTVLQGSAIKRVEPSYPQMARTIRLEGTVVIEITISENGMVESARAISGHPLLRETSLNAARGWRWQPTLLNGVPVKVIGTITFHFKL